MKSLMIVLRMVFQVLIPIAILGGGIIGFVVLSSLREKPQAAEREAVIPLVKTAQVELAGADDLVIEVDGTVVPHREVQLAAEVSGTVTYKSPKCEVGQFVKRDTVLFRIDDEESQLEHDRLMQEKRQAELSRQELDTEEKNLERVLELQQRDLELKRRDVARIQQLIKSGAGTSASLDAARQSELVAMNAVVGTGNQIAQLESRGKTLTSAIDLVDQRLRRAKLDLKRCEIRAPFSGMVVEEHVEKGSFLQRGSVLVTMEDTRRGEVRCNLRMDELYWIWQQVGDEAGASITATDGQQIDPAALASLVVAGSDLDEPGALTPDAVTAEEALTEEDVLQQASYDLPDTPVKILYQLNGHTFEWDGVLTRYDGLGLDERTRTVPCRIDVLEPTVVSVDGLKDNSMLPRSASPALVRGMFVQVRILAHPQTRLLRVPELAIRPDNIVWTVDAEQKLQRVPVRVAVVRDGQAVIYGTSGRLAEGDRVVVSPLSTETPGTVVQEQPQS